MTDSTPDLDREVRVLIVDDSVTMRRLIRNGLASYKGIKVVAEAGTASEARDVIKRTAIDVVTLDVEMPGMSGSEFLERVMRLRPMPIVMLSSLTQEGSDIAVRALSLGAVECVEKPRFGEARATIDRLAELICAVGRKPLVPNRSSGCAATVANTASKPGKDGKIVLIGSSTGGVEALERVFSEFPENCPPTLVTQHMPPQFLASFAARLNSSIAPDVRLATDGQTLREGRILIAPGGDYHLGLAIENGARARLVKGPEQNGHRPSVGVLFESAVPVAPRIIAVMLTGMGRDGAEAMLKLRASGAQCFAQDEATSVVFGMPRAAHELGAVDCLLAIDDIAAGVLDRAMTDRDRSLARASQ